LDLAILLLAAALVRLPFLLQSGNFLDLDEATFGLMAHRFLTGEIPIYFSSQSYLGSFAAFVLFPLTLFLGWTALPVKLTAFLFFLGFFTVNFLLFKKIAGRTAAIFASLFLIFMPSHLFDLSLRVLGGHSELWLFQAALLLLLYRYFEEPPRSPVLLLFAIGLILGTALWICEIFLLFLIPFAIYFFLKFRSLSEVSDFFHLGRFRLPPKLRMLFRVWHGCLVVFFLIHLAGLVFLTPATEKFFHFFGASPPFEIKTLKIVFLILCGEIFLVSWFQTPSASRISTFSRLGSFLGGFLIGYFPAIFFNLAGGEGLRILEKSGALHLGVWVERGHFIFTKRIPEFILDLRPPFFTPLLSIHALANLVFCCLIVFILLMTGIYFRRDKNSYVWIFYGMGIFTIFANLISTLEAARYLAPLYLALTGIFGFFFGKILWPRARALSILIALLMLSHFAYGTCRFYQSVPKNFQSSYDGIIDFLESRNLRGGYASRQISSVLTYLSEEKLVFSSFGIPDRYFAYEDYVGTLKERAYIFETGDSSHDAFKKDAASLSSRVFGPYVVYYPENSEGTDLPYAPSVRKFFLHIYLNE